MRTRKDDKSWLMGTPLVSDAKSEWPGCQPETSCLELSMSRIIGSCRIRAVALERRTRAYGGYGARVHDAATADAMLGAVLEFGHDQLDTCGVYGDGTCEQMLGDLRAAERFRIATRVHSGSSPGSAALNTGGHEPENLQRVFKESLARLKTDKVRILYLVTPDSATPIESTLSAVQQLHDEDLFEEFGVSNFSAWQVAEMSEIAARHGWIRPSVYQGLYNAITRAVEPELFKCLGNYGIRFHAYNPLAGGAFSRNFSDSAAVAAGSRFDSSTAQGKFYRDRYWNDASSSAPRYWSISGTISRP
jgi:aflatoxin B1 aldehyde reductase